MAEIYQLYQAALKLQEITLTILWANTASDKLIILFLSFPRKKKGDILHEMSKHVFWGK